MSGKMTERVGGVRRTSDPESDGVPRIIQKISLRQYPRLPHPVSRLSHHTRPHLHPLHHFLSFTLLTLYIVVLRFGFSPSVRDLGQVVGRGDGSVGGARVVEFGVDEGDGLVGRVGVC